MKLECIEDVVITATKERAFTKGKVYNGYYYRELYPIDLCKKSICVRNDLGGRHHIKDCSNKGLNEFFSKHFKEVPKCSTSA